MCQQHPENIDKYITKIGGKRMFVISIPDLGSKIPIYVAPKVGDLQIFKSVSNFTAGLCIWNLDYHLLLSENCTGQVFRAGRLPEVRSRIGRYQISLLESATDPEHFGNYGPSECELHKRFSLFL